MPEPQDRALLIRLFDAAVGAADPLRAMAPVLPGRPRGRTVVVGAGKGAARMALALEALWDGPLSGAVVTRHGQAAPTAHVRVLEAAHPVPDAAGLAAAKVLLDAVADLTAEDLVIALVSGGGSALLPAPPPGLTLDDEIALNRALLSSGAPISAMNAIRTQVSTIKGGRLAAAAHPARVVTLVVSDVPGDDPAEVASGPTVPCARDRTAALAAAEAWRIALPARVRHHLETAPDDTPDPADPGFARDAVHVIASARRSLEAAEAAARAAGWQTAILSDAIEGEAREAGRVLAAIVREIASRDRPVRRPVILLSGGETTVTLGDAPGHGGRNTEFLLSLALALDGVPGVAALAADTDGIDGSRDNAGAFADGSTAARLRRRGLDPAAILARHDAWHAFDCLGDLFSPGPTGTNVNDFRAILIR